MMRGGYTGHNNNNRNNEDNTHAPNNHMNIYIICLKFLYLPRVTEATQQHMNPWNIGLIIMD